MSENHMFEKKQNFFDGMQSKTSFWIGFGGGLLLCFIIGFFILLGFVVKGVDFGSIAKAEDNAAPVANNNAPTNPSLAPTPSNNNVAAPANIQLAAVNDKDHILGNKNAKISIVEYSDFQCPFCSKHHPTLQGLIKEYGDKVNWVYRHFPLESIHPNARPAANASECASEQGKFWEFSDQLFANQNKLGTDFYKEIAKNLGLNTGQFESCLSANKYDAKVNADASDASRAGGRGTPYNIIVFGDQKIPLSGAQPASAFKQVIDAFLGGK